MGIKSVRVLAGEDLSMSKGHEMTHETHCYLYSCLLLIDAEEGLKTNLEILDAHC